MERVDATAGGKGLRRWLLPLCCAIGWACDSPSLPERERAEPAIAAPAPVAPSLLSDAGRLSRELALVTEPLSKPIRALSLRIYPDRLLLQVQSTTEPSRVEQFRVKDGQVMGPIAVTLTGPGELKDNLFPLQYADLAVIPRLVADAERRAALVDGRTTSVTLQRNLPASMDIRFQVLVEGSQGKRRVEARKDGKIIRVHFDPK